MKGPGRLYVDGAPCSMGCGRTYQRKNKTKHGRCTVCHSRTRADKLRRRYGKPERHPNTVLLWELRREMDAAGKAGCCIYCERLLRPPRLVVCADADCQRCYQNDWRRGRTLARRQAAERRKAPAA